MERVFFFDKKRKTQFYYFIVVFWHNSQHYGQCHLCKHSCVNMIDFYLIVFSDVILKAKLVIFNIYIAKTNFLHITFYDHPTR